VSIPGNHAEHEDLPGYLENAVLQDGCPVCDYRAGNGLFGILQLDDTHIRGLWRVMLNNHWGLDERHVPNSWAARPKPPEMCSANDFKASHLLYQVAVLLERYALMSEDDCLIDTTDELIATADRPWEPDIDLEDK